jgi:hypothetical protein
MVFRGKPSKSCQRCRNRRLRVSRSDPDRHCGCSNCIYVQCDLRRPNCSSCNRAGEHCSGYRGTDTIRIENQSDFTRTKALARTTLAQFRQHDVSLVARYLPHDLQVLGREIFFAHYVSDFSHTWDFLLSYLNPNITPEHLSLGIDAVSLAFLSHQVSSPTAKEMATRKYVEALQKINKAVQDPATASNISTFEGALLLDLFEKMMNPASSMHASRHAHVEGALALVKLRGVENFREGSEIRALLGLSLNAMICALSSGRKIPNEVREIRMHAVQFVDTSYPKWRLSDCILEVTNLPLAMTPQQRVTKSGDLDRKLEIVALEAGPAWSYKRKFVSGYDKRVFVPDGFFPLYDVYPDRMITQMWNVLRVTRIQLCEDIIECCATLQDAESAAQLKRAKHAVVEMIREICASCPQMTNCDFAARQKLPEDAVLGSQHTHTMSHILDVYVLIFSLYVVGWARSCPPVARDWALGQLKHIAEHFSIKEAGLVLEILGKQEEAEERIDPWYVYDLSCRSSFSKSTMWLAFLPSSFDPGANFVSSVLCSLYPCLGIFVRPIGDLTVLHI